MTTEVVADPYRQAKHLVAAITGSTVAHMARISGGRMTYKFHLITSTNNHFILRIYPQHRAIVADYEPQAWIALHRLGMKVPEVIAHTQTGPSFPLAYVLYRMIPGSTLSDRLADLDASSLRELSDAVSTQLRHLDALPIRTFGDLSSFGTALHDNWLSFVTQSISYCLAPSGDDPALRRLRDIAIRLSSRLAKLPIVRIPTLCWCDLSPENIILDEQNRFAGLIDFENLMALEPLAALGYCQARYFGTPFCAAFEETWLDLKPTAQARASLYAVIRAFRVVPYLGTPLPLGMTRDPIDIFLPGLQHALSRVEQRFL